MFAGLRGLFRWAGGKAGSREIRHGRHRQNRDRTQRPFRRRHQRPRFALAGPALRRRRPPGPPRFLEDAHRARRPVPGRHRLRRDRPQRDARAHPHLRLRRATTSRSSSGPRPRLRTRRSIRSRPIFPTPAGPSANTGPARDEIHRSPEAEAAHPRRRLAGRDLPAAQGGPVQPRAAGRRGRRLPARRGPARDDDRSRRAVPRQPPRAGALRGLRRRRDDQGLRLPRLHDPPGHREALPDAGQLQRGPLRRRADLRHLRLGPRRLLLPGRGDGRGHRDLAAGRVHPHHHARDRAPPLPPPLARRRRPPHRLRHGLHAGLARPGEDHVARGADHRQPQDLRHDRHRRRPPGHHPGDPGRDRGHADDARKRGHGPQERRHRGQRHPPADEGRRLPLEGGHDPMEPRRPRRPGPGAPSSTRGRTTPTPPTTT